MQRLPKQRGFTGPALIWKRVIAFMLDLLVLEFFIITPFRKVITDIIPEGNISAIQAFLMANLQAKDTLIWITFMIGSLMLVYFAVLEYSIGQTAGKLLMKIEVVSDRKETSMWQYVVRSMFIIPVIPFVLLWVIDPIYMFLNENNQRFTERISMTRTIERFVIE
jgi:uncharacterized RDD family membrane protein YckC